MGRPPITDWTSEKRQYTVEAQGILDALGAANAGLAAYPID